jgi:VacB/RNase II family 3'-5' exoribonuclease
MSEPIPSSRERLQAIARRAMLERGLQPDFSSAALAETNALAETRLEPGGDVRDLRPLLWCSIDNDDSRDLDQLTVAEPLAGGAVRVLVAIADVAATVERGSAIDAHASANTTSVYTVAQIFPMLPERLSTDLTSLGEDRERPAIVIEMVVAPDGAVASSDVCLALVLNRARLSYDAVAAWLDGAAPPPERLASLPALQENLQLQDRAARAMKEWRHHRGALSLDSSESRAVFDGDSLAELRPDEKTRAKELIEDFMIGANGATAQYLERRGFTSLRRVLRTPARWGRIVELAAGLGERLPAESSAAALQQFLSRRRQADPLRFPDVSLSVIKLLGSGEYVVETPGQRVDGHFGLALKDYTHSTAPNRRFPDLATQRLLKAAIAGHPSPYSDDTLAQLARHATQQEDNAAKVERQVRKSAGALLLSSRIGERFEAIVTGASPKGTWVRTLKPRVEGKLVHDTAELDVGDRLHVELVATDVERGFIDFARLDGKTGPA